MTMYTLRLFEDHEWEDLRFIRMEALKNSPDMLGQPYADVVAFTKENWLEWTGDPLRGYFGIYHGDDLIGLFFVRIFSEDMTQARISSLYIRREYHRKGIDKLLFETAFDWARQMKCTSIKAGCKENNYASKRLIEKYGGVFTGREDEPLHYPDGSTGHTLWYRVDLDNSHI